MVGWHRSEELRTLGHDDKRDVEIE
jgi:hypothetical protein